MPVTAPLVMGDDSIRLIGFYLYDKKFHKLRWDDLVNVCKKHGYEPRRIDIEKPLEEQGPFKVLIHKLTDILPASDSGEPKSREIIKNVEQYILKNPEMVVIDPIDNVRILLDRYTYYSLLEKQPILISNGVFTPTFCLLTSNVQKENMNIMRARGVTFPLVCKTSLAHGSRSAHRMSVIFNEAGLSHCKPQCVLQSFVNHNAVLYKVFLVGNRYHIVERPSLKNFYPSNDKETIHFNTGEVCKADSQSTLSILDPHEVNDTEDKVGLNEAIIETILKVLRKELNLTLFGVDIVIDNKTNAYAIIDINFYPGYEGFPNFFDHLIECIDDLCKNLDTNEKTLHAVLNEGGDSLNSNGFIPNKNNKSQQCLINVRDVNV